MQLYFIRHGQSENNLLWTTTNGIDGRVPDPRLTKVGEAQAQQVADLLAQPDRGSDPNVDFQNTRGFGITHLYCSLMTRAIQTGLPSAAALNLPLVALPTIHEYHGIHQMFDDGDGKWRREPLPGPNRHYFTTHFPELVLPDDLQEAGWWRSRKETHLDMLRRAEQSIEWLWARHSAEDRVVIISHGAFYQAFIYALLELGQLPTSTKSPTNFFNLNNIYKSFLSLIGSTPSTFGKLSIKNLTTFIKYSHNLSVDKAAYILGTLPYKQLITVLMLLEYSWNMLTKFLFKVYLSLR